MEKEEFAVHADITEKVSNIPQNPGVYLMKDRQGSVMYIGKAKALRNRVRSYFQRLQDTNPKTRIMVSKIADIETIITPTEKDALILENTLIKKYRPRYNVVFRDDKEYPYLRLSVAEPFPNLTVVRKPKKDGSVYFGPFASAQAVRDTLKVMHKMFPLRKCKGKLVPKPRPCLYHDLGQCLAPCSQSPDPADYRRVVKDVQMFLQGRSRDVLAELKQRMEQASADLNFELAAQLRDQITGIEKTLAKQTIVSLDCIDRDVFSFFRREQEMVITALFVRSGRMIGSRSFFLKKLRLGDEEALASCLSQYYHQGEFIPDEIIVPTPLEEQEVLQDFLIEKKGSPVKIVHAQRGARKDLLDMAAQNAESIYSQKRSAARDSENMLVELQQRLHLQTVPLRIECFDISNIMGSAAVGSLVVFYDGLPLKDDYRRYRIKTVDQPDDYAMMREVIDRRLEGIQNGEPKPDLIVVDGGKGQLAVLCKALEEYGFDDIGAAGLAKGKDRDKAKKLQEEKLFLPGRKNHVVFPKNSPALFLLQRVRDEAHRFAVSYHKKVKTKQDLTSVLEDVPGIGKGTARAVLKHFGSLDVVKRATLEEIERVPSITKPRAELIYDFFHYPEED